MNTSSFCDKNLGLRTSAHSAIWCQRARSQSETKTKTEIDDQRSSGARDGVYCLHLLLFIFIASFVFINCFTTDTHTHTHWHTLSRHTLSGHAHTHAARSGRGKANEFTQKKLHNALSDTFTKLARFFFFCFSTMHTGNNNINNNKYCVYFCCRATDTFNVAHKTHHTCCMWNIFPRVSKIEPSCIFSLLLVGMLHEGRGKETTCPTMNATGNCNSSICICHRCICFRFFLAFPICFSCRVSADSVNIGIMSEHRFHYKVQFTLSSWSPLPFLFLLLRRLFFLLFLLL